MVTTGRGDVIRKPAGELSGKLFANLPFLGLWAGR
jgi:hypothetical protein